MNAYTVTQVNLYIHSLLAENALLKHIFIKGEISNYTVARSGHAYFTLKDSNAQISCVMYAGRRQALRFQPEHGMKVICSGSVEVYDRRGEYQLKVADMHADGVGDLQIAFEQLKTKLGDEGLFRDEHKKELPPYPQKIGVATSDTGAAVEDIKNILSRRYPLCEIVIVPTLVQGDAAPADIVKSVRYLDSRGDMDIIIVGRGGGSLEDLWAFNTEEVARAVYACQTPVISAVGHETDYTICDEVADLRAPTPSAAAELAVPDIEHEKILILNLKRTLYETMDAAIREQELRIDSIKHKSVLAQRDRFLDMPLQNIQAAQSRMRLALCAILQRNEQAVAGYARALNALSPLAVLARGYSVTKKDGRVVDSVAGIQEGNELLVLVSDGELKATVTEVKKHE